MKKGNFDYDETKKERKNTKVKSAKEFSLENLELSKGTLGQLYGLPQQDIIYLLRTNKLRSKGVSRAACSELLAAADEAGFIRHDITPEAFRVNRLLEIVVADTVYQLVFKPHCSYADFGSNEEYEGYPGLVKKQIDALNQLMVNVLEPEQAKIVQLHFGLSGSDPKPLKDIGKQFGITGEYARYQEAAALMELRAPENMAQISVILIPEDACLKRIDDLRASIAWLKHGLCSLCKSSPFVKTDCANCDICKPI